MGVPGLLPKSQYTSATPLLLGLAAVWLLLWTLLSLTEVAVLIHSPRVPLWHALAIALVPPAVAGAWLGLALSTRTFETLSIEPGRRWFFHQLRALPLLVVAGVFCIWGLRELVFRLIGTDYGYHPPPIYFPVQGLKIVLFYLLWLGLMYGLLTLAKWRLDSEQMLAVQKALAEAQLAQLQAQLRPHFLFNALNTVSSLMMTDATRADRVLAQLGDLLRASLRGGQTKPVPLRDELSLLEKYAEVMQERFEGRAVVHWDVDSALLDVPVPAMLLQPLLENAFKHGVERSVDPVHIRIRAHRVGDQLALEIHNSGSNLSGTPAGDDCVGLRNCRERLRLLYGSAAELAVIDAASGGVSASVTLPCAPQAV